MKTTKMFGVWSGWLLALALLWPATVHAQRSILLNSGTSAIISPTNVFDANHGLLTNALADDFGLRLLASDNLSDVANAGTSRTNLAAHSAANLTIGELPDARLSANVSLLGNSIDLASEVAGNLPVENLSQAIAPTWTDLHVFNQAPRIPRTDLAGGTTLTLQTYYEDTLSANRTLAFNTAMTTEGQSTSVKFNVSADVTLTFPSSKVIGGADSASTTMFVPPGVHFFIWAYLGGEVCLFHSVSVVDNLTATVDPAVTDDLDLGYSVGSIWINVSADTAWICVDNADGAANWDQINGAAGAGGSGSETWLIMEPDLVRAATDNMLLKKFPAEMYPSGVTLTSIHIDASAAYTSETFTFEEWDEAADGTPSTVEVITCSAISTEDDGTLADAVIAADSFLFVDFDDTPEDVVYVSITVTWDVN